MGYRIRRETLLYWMNGERDKLMSLSEANKTALKIELATISTEHRKLDSEIRHMTEAGDYDQLEIQRLKRKKLLLKDEIIVIEGKLLPDIIA